MNDATKLGLANVAGYHSDCCLRFSSTADLVDGEVGIGKQAGEE